MADDSAARKSKRPPRGSRSLGAVRKGAEGNATTATPRNGTREPLLSKQTPAYDNDWDEDVSLRLLICDKECLVEFICKFSSFFTLTFIISLFLSGLGRL